MPRYLERQAPLKQQPFTEEVIGERPSLYSDEYFYRVTQRQMGTKSRYSSQSDEAATIRRLNEERQEKERKIEKEREQARRASENSDSSKRRKYVAPQTPPARNIDIRPRNKP